MPMLHHPSAVQLLSHFMLHDPELQALVGDRVHGGWSRDTDLQTIPKPAVGFVLDSGGTVYEGVIGAFGTEIWAVSANSADEALEVYTTVYKLLQAECLAVNGIDHRGMCVEVDSVRQGWAKDAACWYAHGRWIYRVARTTIGPVP